MRSMVTWCWVDEAQSRAKECNNTEYGRIESRKSIFDRAVLDCDAWWIKALNESPVQRR